VADWVTISALATAGGTLALAVSTLASVRSANRAARVAEQSLLANLRPLLVPSRIDDPTQEVPFSDDRLIMLPGGGAVVERADNAIYLAISLRNVANGIAVLHGWRFEQGWHPGGGEQPGLDEFNRLTRDIYVAPSDLGYWQGTFRDPASTRFQQAAAAIESGDRITVDVLYGDQEGGQRMISRISIRELEEGRWVAASGRHWHLDRPAPR
jgi:hypothetical protein